MAKMPNRVNREKLLQQLEMVQPGLSAHELVEQGSCFIFGDGMVWTYNDEVLCQFPCSLKLKGAIHSKALLEVLRRRQEEELEVIQKNGELIFKYKRRETGLTMQNEILLDISSVEKPMRWHTLPEGFNEAIDMVQYCAGTDETTCLVCVHIHPNWIEATDDVSACRYELKTGAKESILVRRDAIKHVPKLGMTEVSQTESWLHFRNSQGLQMSCRKYKDDFPSTDDVFKVKGTKMTLPTGIKQVIDCAEIFTAEKENDNNMIMVDLRPGKMRLRGIGSSGWHKDIKDIKYSGEELSFLIPPQLLLDLAGKYKECEIGQERLKVKGPGWVYVTSLGVDEDNEEEEDESEDEEE